MSIFTTVSTRLRAFVAIIRYSYSPASAPYYHWCTILPLVHVPQNLSPIRGNTFEPQHLCIHTNTWKASISKMNRVATSAILSETRMDPAITNISAFALFISNTNLLYILHDLWKCTFINRPSLFSHTLVSLIVFVLGPLTSPGVMVWSNLIYVIMAAVPSPQ